MKRLNTIDNLTGLYDREGFNELSRKEIDRACRENYPISLFYLDVDNYAGSMKRNRKKLGEELLIQISNCLKKNCRKTDLIARLKDGEFVILAPQIGAEPAMMILHRLREALDHAIADRPRSPSASIGAVTYLSPPGSIDSMLKQIETHRSRSKKKRSTSSSYKVLDKK